MTKWIKTICGFWLFASAGLALGQSPASSDEEPAWSLLRQHVHPWERYVRGFRVEHHFAFSVGGAQGLWKVKNFGSIKDRQFKRQGAYAKIQYSFHLPIAGGFGYFLGSSLGAYLPEPSGQKEFLATNTMQLPGFLIGLVWNFSPSWRLSLGLDHYLERVEDLRDEVSQPAKHLSITMLALLDTQAAIDFFYSLNWALRLEGHWRQVYYEKPKRSADKLEDASLKKTDQWLGLGMVYHFL